MKPWTYVKHKVSVARKYYRCAACYWWLQGHVKKDDDGHMVGGDTYPYYLRDRKKRHCFYDSDYCLRFVHQPESVELIYQDWRLK